MGKSIKKIILSLFILILLVIAGGLIYFKTAFPSGGSIPDLSVEITDESIANGAYLANHVYACMSCHSDRAHQLYAKPVMSGTLGKGGYLWDEAKGMPGKVYAPNITPFHLSDWTDGEIFYAITTGISKDGRALFPMMPYPSYGKLDPKEIYDIIAYIRSLDTIEYKVPSTELSFPMSLIVNMIPSRPEFTSRPDASDPVALGKYLVTAASCNDCHTPMVKGQYDMSRMLSGGNEFVMDDGSIVRSSNITPHKASGIGGWSERMFVQRFKMYADSSYNSPIVPHKTINTEMPWNEYSGMKVEELKAIWAYLRTVPALENTVERYTAEPVMAAKDKE